MSTFMQNRSAQDFSVSDVAQTEEWHQSSAFAEEFENGETETEAVSRDSVDLRLALLARAIEHEIIPRLMLAHRTTAECLDPPAQERQTVARQEVESFAKLVLSRDPDVSRACIETMRSHGISVETIFSTCWLLWRVTWVNYGNRTCVISPK